MTVQFGGPRPTLPTVGRWYAWVLVWIVMAPFAAGQQAAGTGTVAGTVTDAEGKLVQRARVTLTPDSPAEGTALVGASDEEGEFVFAQVPAGKFVVAVTAEGFDAATVDGAVAAGQRLELAAIVLQVGLATEVTVSPQTNRQLAELDVKEEEKQKVFGIIPNFFVVYKDNPLPLDGRQKLELSVHGITDPFPFVASGFVAGVQQAANTLPGYQQGLKGYAKRYGAAYTNFASATMLRDGLFPAVFHQDPRYYYRGKGTKTSRVLYALSTAVVCKGDNGRNQFAYAALLGNLSAGALTNLYYPAGSKNGLSTTFENGALATLGVGAGHVLQEFLFSRITNKKAAVAGK